MLANYIISEIKAQLLFEPNEQQKLLIETLSNFLLSKDKEKIFLLKGYAGTGKTSIVSAMVKAMEKLHQRTILLAPTGRAAKVIANYAGMPAFTIHKKIYRQKSLADFHFQLSENLHSNTLFIVDEASMISETSNDKIFGSGHLFDDLLKYVYGGNNCSLMLLGDTAQLPPVKEEKSPALDTESLKNYGLNVTEFTLTQVMRQALESGILYNATKLRNHLSKNKVSDFPYLKIKNFKDIVSLPASEFVNEIQQAYEEAGINETIVITRSNYKANYYNQGIRNRVLFRESELTNGDLLMVTRNNYFWSQPYEGIDFIANGDILEVKRIRRYTEMYGFRFVDVTLHSLDENWEIDAKLWLDSLQSENPFYTEEMYKTLLERISEDYSEIKKRKEKIRKIFENEYYNALQVKFAYAITCHKSQGGQWERVFIDPGLITEVQINADFYHWLYTALTRATKKVFLVNFSEKFFKKNI